MLKIGDDYPLKSMVYRSKSVYEILGFFRDLIFLNFIEIFLRFVMLRQT
jgi:hypothetical protein